MKEIDIYQQYFEADCVYNGVQRRAADLRLTAVSDAGTITYRQSVSFFIHEDPEDFRISGDAYAERIIFEGKGRRSKKKETVYLESMNSVFDELAEELGGRIFWDRPLIEARLA